MDKKWIHIIGIAGVTTSAVAVMFKNLGWHVTGSDNDIYDPGKSILEKNGIKINTEYSYSNLIDNGKMPDLVLIQSGKPTGNKEYLFAKKQNLNIKNYPQILEEFVVKPDASIVVAGTFGKSTLTALLVFILQKFNIDISYMLGAFSDSISETIKPRLETTKFSVIEGDEYIASREDPKSKFFYYHPKYLLLNPVEWDHSDVFKSKEDYLENFINLVKTIPEDGIIFAIDTVNNRKILESVICTKVLFLPERYSGESKLVGDFNLENIEFIKKTITYLVQNNILNINLDSLDRYINEFSGVKRRLEIRHSDDNLVVIDDFGSSPAKVRGSLSSVRKIFPDHKKIIIFEPNEGSRTHEILDEYKDLFDPKDTVILPEFRDIPGRISNHELEEFLKKNGVQVETSDEVKLVELIRSKVQDKSLVLFLGSHDFEKFISGTWGEVRGS